MLVLEYKAVTKKHQEVVIDEAIRTSKFVRNKVLRYWMDNRGVGKKELYRYNTQIRSEFKFVEELNSHACQASVENAERAINRLNAAINILVKALGPRDDGTGRDCVERKVMPSKTATGGQPGSNARGVATSTLLGESLIEQVATGNRESSRL